MKRKAIWFRAFAVSALLVAAGMPSKMQAVGYQGCASDGCNGAYCWGNTCGTTTGCTDGLGGDYPCVVWYTMACPPCIGG
jgi:hypothetical protein